MAHHCVYYVYCFIYITELSAIGLSSSFTQDHWIAKNGSSLSMPIFHIWQNILKLSGHTIQFMQWQFYDKSSISLKVAFKVIWNKCPEDVPCRYDTVFVLTELEIVDQWSTRIPLPHRRGWQWAMGGYVSIVPLKFGVDIQSQTKVRVRKPKNPIWLPGGHFESDVAENQQASTRIYKYCAT